MIFIRFSECTVQYHFWLVATYFNSLNTLKVLIRIEQEAQLKYPEDLLNRRPPYGTVSEDNPCFPSVSWNLSELEQVPLFQCLSSEAVQMYLEAGLHHLEDTNRLYDKLPLLHCCIIKGILSESTFKWLEHQAGLEWRGLAAIDWGITGGNCSVDRRQRKLLDPLE